MEQLIITILSLVSSITGSFLTGAYIVPSDVVATVEITVDEIALPAFEDFTCVVDEIEFKCSDPIKGMVIEVTNETATSRTFTMTHEYRNNEINLGPHMFYIYWDDPVSGQRTESTRFTSTVEPEELACGAEPPPPPPPPAPVSQISGIIYNYDRALDTGDLENLINFITKSPR
ncbi:MAG: hypothetical protein US50_C0010G0009 [Candidatus Nomurabacteria bacterium GW2011_GWB1_37_5]|uniref:Uncharacterized protein n=1 Tax=Candidatus Nomurabacteria bacterium GW2011_GWB1_37_5 TaxID=1618742 RepID=A0A0G0K4S5_9BACT|nr:MAG: hypothetical protein US50_C0010G0009 [Candidatus Nomurabacteria bacterium GW2011_GWB1_37_5]